MSRIYLFEKIKKENNQIDYIFSHLDDLLNSFCLNHDIYFLPEFYGINIWNLDLDELKLYILQEEPRIKNLQIKKEQNKLTMEIALINFKDVYNYEKFLY